MVILLGGCSCTGKTYIAHKMMSDYQISYFSIDYLKIGLFRSNPNCGFTPTDDDRHIAKILWPIIKEMIYTYIENEQDIIIEGAYLLPEFMSSIDTDYQNDVHMILVGFSKHYLKVHFEDHVLYYKGVIENRPSEDERPLSAFINMHQSLKDQAKTFGIEYHEIHDDYHENIKLICRKILSLR